MKIVKPCNLRIMIFLDYNDVELVSKKKVSYNDLKSSNFDGIDFSKIQSKK